MPEDIIVEDNNSTYSAYLPVILRVLTICTCIGTWTIPKPVHYFPESAWNSTNDPERSYHGHSYHFTYASGAYATFNFTGSYVAYYSDHHTDHGSFNVSIDGTTTELSSYGSTLVENITLFAADLSYGAHTLTVKNLEDNKAMGVDYFVYRTTSPIVSASPQAVPTTFETSTTPFSATAGSTVYTASPETGGVLALDPAAVAGVAFGALASVIVLIMVGFVVRRRCVQHRRWSKVGESKKQKIRMWRKQYGN
ncbi:hypothetical protein AURDEDRAFT_165636 [Auricularia subglabra TFB-10046 SS5]|nr:hypothetical protein AURDEDRAFT_165636 [Auricularia subglabra TFB-10046 SS5]